MSFGKLDRYIRSIPKIYRAGQNPVITAFLEAFASSDEEVSQQIQNTKAQLFVRTAEGKPLDQLANSLGVSRPVSLGLDDATFQKLIPNLSLKAKQIRKAFYDTCDVFWGPLFSHANLETDNSSTFSLFPGENLTIQIDIAPIQTIAILAGEIANPGFATAEEVATILSKIKGATSSIIEDAISGDQKINIRTNTPGPLGSVKIFESSTMIGPGKLELSTIKRELRDQDQRVMVYNINPNELIIEIPAVVPALRRVLKGSHHFHEDSTLKLPVAPGNGIWQGGFFYAPTGVSSNITVTSQSARLDQTISKNGVYTSIIVDDTSNIIDKTGFVVFGWGTDHEESAVRIRGIPNNKTILIDPAYIFQNNHPVNTYVNIIAERKTFIPSRSGADLPIYLTSPSGAREVVQDILRTLAAAGILLNFIILSPKYKYLIDNPYLLEDNVPVL
jgi:hypothetical protein